MAVRRRISATVVITLARYNSAMIIHVDMDAFYASVEEREDPSLKGRPLVVAGQADSRGVVSAANYAAREFGVHSAMPTATAVRLCRDLAILPVRMTFYSEVSAQIKAIFNRYTPLGEPLSLDEAFLDPRGGERLHGDAVETAAKIKRDILEELDLIASVGVAPNKFLAKLASDYDKPDGFTVVQEQEVLAFLDSLSLKQIWGVGPATARRLNQLGIYTVSELREKDLEYLQHQLGRQGEHFWNLARGIDERRVCPEHEAKSISHEVTFAKDIQDWHALEAVLIQLTESVGERLRRNLLKGRTVTLKLRDSGFNTLTSSHTLATPTDVTNEIWHVARRLLRNQPKYGQPIRLAGIGVSHFDEKAASQADLFAFTQTDESGTEIDQLTDAIQQKFGRKLIQRARGISSKR